MATLRLTKRNEFNPRHCDIEEILPTDEPENTRFIWRSMTRELQRMGFKSRWEVQTKIGGKWEGDGELYTCSCCGAIYPVIAGNIYDGMERCDECGAEFDNAD